MVQLLDLPYVVEEEAPLLDLEMPRVYRRPPAPPFQRGQASILPLIARAREAHLSSDGPGFGKAYGELVVEFQPAIQWALTCWDYLLSTEGCRFVPRSIEEKRYCRGDYRVFAEKEFHPFVHRAFKNCLVQFLNSPSPPDFPAFLKQNLWPMLLENYRILENPPDPRQRTLTPYSYLRCVPYQFLNDYHHGRVTAAVDNLSPPQRQLVELYYLRFYKEEAVLATTRINLIAFRRRRAKALRTIAGNDYLSYVLLNQIERY